MARRNKSGGGGGGDNDWLNTYADMVTLLMCFFVLLFASSEVDAEKYEMIVKSFARTDAETAQVILTPEGDGEDMASNQGDGTMVPDETLNPDTANQLPQTMEDLYEYLQQYVSENNLEGSVHIEKQDNLVFVRFNDNIFFHPDQAVLLDSAVPIIETITSALVSVNDEIANIRINGYTAQVDGPSFVNDRVLSSDRANAVAGVFDDAGIPPHKTIAIGYGKNYPIADNSTEEGRAQNRRVELMIIGTGFDPTDPEALAAITDQGLDPAFHYDYSTPTDFGEGGTS